MIKAKLFSSSTIMSWALLVAELLLLALLAPTAECVAVLRGCQARCGSVDVPYPFGISSGCFREGFEINCTNNGRTGSEAPFLAGTSIPVASLSVDPPVSQVMLPIGWQCYNGSASRRRAVTDMKSDGVYRISNTQNKLFVLGCSTVAMVIGIEGAEVSGCVSYCGSDTAAHDGVCTGAGCCSIDILPGLTGTQLAFQNNSRRPPWMRDYSPCDYAFLVDRTNYTFRKSDLQSMDRGRTMPVQLDWAIRNTSCAAAVSKPGYACLISNYSECVSSTNGPGYTCKCIQGYRGNAYAFDGVDGGCAEINECEQPDNYTCLGNCTNTQGSYNCTCPPGQQSRDPKKEPCTPKFSPGKKLGRWLVIGIILGLSFVVALLSVLLNLQKRRTKGFFRKNGGLILRNVETLKIFTKEEINKITKNQSEVLGKGCFGKVYKGILPDGTAVAVKTSIEINKARKEEFTKEVDIQSQMIHKNIIKLIGCCLEVDVPMLVYEFAANGSLQDILHGKTHPFPLDLRLDIAIDAAEGLTYMHSSTNRTIRHGDVKPANILLDDKNMPKISDFGTSKFLTKDKDHTMFVVGSMGYIDPIFIETGQLTQKSDVYNFGVVLLELITRKPIVYDGNRRLIVEFRNVPSMFDKDISTEEDIYILEEIGRLAVACLQKDVEDRPEMKEVAERLAMLRRARKSRNINYRSSHYLEEIGIDGAPGQELCF